MYCEVSELLGKTLVAITGADEGNDEIIFECSDGSKYRMFHDQECCENVTIEDICGDVCMFDGKNVKLFRSAKGNWLLTYEGDWHKSFAIALDEEKAKDILLSHDLKAYEKMFGELEEA